MNFNITPMRCHDTAIIEPVEALGAIPEIEIFLSLILYSMQEIRGLFL
jgi:hypothetical protein